MSFDEFAREVCERLRADMQSVRDPAGDVRAAVFYLHSTGLIRRMKLPPSAFESRRTKDALAAAIATAARFTHPRMIAFAHTIWYSVIDTDRLTPEQVAAFRRNEHPEDIPQPSEDPERREKLLVTVFDHEQTGAWVASIERDGRNPPVYGPWEREPGEPQGLMIDPLREAMRA